MKLLFFDIDGTLIRSRGAGRNAVETGMTRFFRQPIRSNGIAFSGKTDPQILAEVLILNGLEPNEANIQKAAIAYATVLEEQLSTDTYAVIEGIPSILDQLLAHPDAELSLLTGNFEKTAFLKLASANLDAYFHHGAFGSDHADRNALPPIGLARVFRETGRRFLPHEAYIIGDTPLDIACARAHGLHAIAVATGYFSTDALAQHQPDLLLKDFSDPTPLFHYIFGAP